MGWIFPANSTYLSSYYGWRNYDYSYHLGFDVAVNRVPVYSVADGNIIARAWYTGGGWGLALQTNNIDPLTGKKLIVRYLHLNNYSTAIANVERLDRDHPFLVNKGVAIATSGNTGGSDLNPPITYGYHLHFDVNNQDKTGKDFNIVFADTINPHEFYPNIQFTGVTEPDPVPKSANNLFQSIDSVYDSPEYVFDYSIIKYVGEEQFFNWLNQLSMQEQNLSNFKKYFNIADEVFNEIVGE